MVDVSDIHFVSLSVILIKMKLLFAYIRLTPVITVATPIGDCMWALQNTLFVSALIAFGLFYDRKGMDFE